MFDQSFSEHNLLKIYSEENKKGNNLASRFFDDIGEEYKNINRIRELIRRAFKRKRHYSKDIFEKRIELLYTILRRLKNRKDEILRQNLKLISSNISARDFRFTVNKGSKRFNDKDVYLTESSIESFFAEKQIQRNIKYTYGVKQADRDLIIPQLRSVLDDRFPKIVIKTDIKSFYESIDRKLLLKKLNESPILSLTTRKLIARLLESYGEASSSMLGIPRGIGVSAYLSELYLKRFDSQIETLPNLIFYSRYVDDIVIVLTNESDKTVQDYFNLLKDELDKDRLRINPDPEKTKLIDIQGANVNFSFDYLGYSFNYLAGRIKLELSQKTIKKYNKRITATINAYKKNSIKQPNKAKKELLLRLKFLTYNTKLSNNKGNAVVGIYNSNKWITNPACLRVLDNKIIGLSKSIANPSIKHRISKFSFQKGFEQRLFANFTISEFFTITKVW